MSDPMQAVDYKSREVEKEPRSNRLRTGLLVLGSALFGGIAVVLWNRRTLANMQNQPLEKTNPPSPVDDDAIY
ncbi:MAG TPA: hypothetical protein VK798_03200 [Alloacidobacterium sp.]|jgi:hypothetical protein|nr:hypothetical protein [Alloacidobacterium sp.]